MALRITDEYCIFTLMDTDSYDLFGELLKANQSLIRSYIRSIGVASSSVDDIAQEALLIAYKRFSTYDRKAEFAAWVCTIARHLVWNDRRKTSNRYKLLHQHLTDYMVSRDPSDILADNEVESLERMALRECMKKIPEENRKLVETRYHGNQEPTEMAEKLGMRPDSIRHRLMRVRKALRHCIEVKLKEHVNK